MQVNAQSNKVVMVGPPCVGKTSIVTRLRGGIPSTFEESTVGCSFVRITTENIDLNIWDTAGQERYMSIVPMYYRNADLVIFTFDVTDLSSIEAMSKFIHLFFSIMPGDNRTKFLFVGNKMDLDHVSETTLINHVRSDPYVVQHDLVETEILLVSALYNTGMTDLLAKMVGLITALPKIEPDVTVSIPKSIYPILNPSCCHK